MNLFSLRVLFIIISLSTFCFSGCISFQSKKPVNVPLPEADSGYKDLSGQVFVPPAISGEIKKYCSSRKWKYVVIHHSASLSGNAAQFDKMHRKRGWNRGLGYHFVIGNGNGSGNGEVEIGPRWKKQIDGAHAGVKEYNKYGIGICLVGNFEDQVPSERQLATLSGLINYFQEKYNIPSENVILHRHVKQTACPGRQFPYFDVLSKL